MNHKNDWYLISFMYGVGFGCLFNLIVYRNEFYWAF